MVSGRQRRRMMLSSHPFVRGSEGDVSLYRQCPAATASGSGSQECHCHSVTEVRHRLFVVLCLTVAGVVAGCRSLMTIWERATDPDLNHDAESPRV